MLEQGGVDRSIESFCRGNAMVIVGDGRGVRNRQPKPPTKQGDDCAPIREPANRRHFGEGGHKAERRMPALYGAGDDE